MKAQIKLNLMELSCGVTMYCGRLWLLPYKRKFKIYPQKIIIPTANPTRCTNVSNLFYFGMTLYMFRTVIPSTISSSRLYIQQQALVNQILLSACCVYSLQLLMMDGKTVQNM